MVEKKESESTASLVDVDSPHVVSVHSNFEDQGVKTTTQAERIEREFEEETKQKEAKASKREKARAKKDSLRHNAENPVVLGNALLIAGIGAALGYGAYHRHTEGKLSWETIGWWSGAVGLFATADYFVSKYVFEGSQIGARLPQLVPRILTSCFLRRWFIQNKYPLDK